MPPDNPRVADNAELRINRRNAYALIIVEESLCALLVCGLADQREGRDRIKKDHCVVCRGNEGVKVTRVARLRYVR